MKAGGEIEKEDKFGMTAMDYAKRNNGSAGEKNKRNGKVTRKIK